MVVGNTLLEELTQLRQVFAGLGSELRTGLRAGFYEGLRRNRFMFGISAGVLLLDILLTLLLLCLPGTPAWLAWTLPGQFALLALLGNLMIMARQEMRRVG